jgi:hypothetical protein
MAHVTVTMLERKVGVLNAWINNHHKLHHLTAQKLQERNYYVAKLTEMDEHDLKTIEI